MRMATNISPVISEEESIRRKRLREHHLAEERKQSLERFRQAQIRGLKNLWNNLLFFVSVGCLCWGVMSYRAEIQNKIVQMFAKADARLEASSVHQVPLNDEKEVNEITK